jgi:hypothetical protein
MACFLVMAVLSHSQIDQEKLDSLHRNIDSNNKATIRFNDSMKQRTDSMIYSGVNQIDEELMERNRNAMLELYNQRQEDQKRKGILYLAFGIGMAVLLVFGLLRRKKQSAKK